MKVSCCCSDGFEDVFQNLCIIYTPAFYCVSKMPRYICKKLSRVCFVVQKTLMLKPFKLCNSWFAFLAITFIEKLTAATNIE